MNASAERTIGLVGCGHRGVVGFLGSLKSIGRAGSVTALCDPNPARLAFAWEFLGEADCRRHEDLGAFLADPGFDTVIVATPGHSHADIVVAAFQAGKHVVCEKPMATRLEDCRRMMAAADGREFRIAFNFRYHELAGQVKEIVRSGRIGRVLTVEARDVVGWKHGADYFRRWHRFLANSGGLLVHKATHTFDVVNWWLEDAPDRVTAQAARAFYLPSAQRGERCSGCPAKGECPFYVDLERDIEGQHSGIEGFYRRMYLDGERHDGYVRDACVFDGKSDVPDTYQVLARYRGGAMLSYAAVFYAPEEDRQFVLQGDRGRLEVSRLRREIRLTSAPEARPEETHRIAVEPGGHEGADVRLMKALFERDGRDSAHAAAEAGYWSVALADCANRSIASGAPVDVPPP